MFEDSNLRIKLGKLFSAETDRFDELVAAAGLDPKTDLVGANLSGADFAGSIMDGWNLSRCNLTGASFSGARIRNLITRDAVGVNLTGSLEFNETEEPPEVPKGSFEWIVRQIRDSKIGTERGPLIKTLVKEHVSDTRTWSFLIDQHLRRERVGRLVSMIIDAWASIQPDGDDAGNALRFELLRGGNPYITVRARLLRELATRLGRNDELLDVCKSAIQREGYWTTGITALSILGEVFSERGDVRSFLLGLMTGGAKWLGFKYNVVAPLLKGFDDPSVRRTIEKTIVNQEHSAYDRAQVLSAYHKARSDDPDVARFVDDLFEHSSESGIRAAALRAKSLDEISPDFLKRLRAILTDDEDHQIRTAAINVIGSRKDQLEFLVERAGLDPEKHVRYAAVQAINRLGYNNRQWYFRIFQNGPDDLVRGAALDWILSHDHAPMGDELRSLLIAEMKRVEPSYSAARAARVVLNVWPDDSEIRVAVEQVIAGLPSNMIGWERELRKVITQLDRKAGM